jgi:AraC-like DNA-binding protein
MESLLSSRLTRLDAFDDGVNAWSMSRVAPPEALTGVIQGYSDYGERTGGFTTRRELPHAEAVFIVNLGDPLFVTGGDGHEIGLGRGEAFVAGVHLRPALTRSTGSQTGVHVFLPLESLRRLLGIPIDELINRTLPLDAILGAEATRLSEPLLYARNRDERITLLDAALVRRFARSAPLSAQQAQALWLLRRRPDPDIAAIARDIGWSRKHLAERIRDAVGVWPRSFRRLLRFQRLTGRLRGSPKPDWAMLALETGYCDQSHMIREFREFAELTPSEYMTRSLPENGGVVEQ